MRRGPLGHLQYDKQRRLSLDRIVDRFFPGLLCQLFILQEEDQKRNSRKIYPTLYSPGAYRVARKNPAARNRSTNRDSGNVPESSEEERVRESQTQITRHHQLPASSILVSVKHANGVCCCPAG